MKNYLLFAASLLTLVSCSSDDILSGGQGAGTAREDAAINFDSYAGKITRATSNSGTTAAEKLDKQFKIYGVKSGSTAGSGFQNVYVNYWVWSEDANTTTTNTKGWEYVGKKDQKEIGADKDKLDKDQTIKFWDYSAADYRFVAGSPIKSFEYDVDETSHVIKSATIKGLKGHITPNKVGTETWSAATEPSPVYVAKPIIVSKDNYNKPVEFNFVRQQSKVRVGFYETIPGYKISAIKFYKQGESGLELDNDNANNVILTSTAKDYFVGAENAIGTITYDWSATPSYTFSYKDGEEAQDGKASTKLTKSKNWYGGEFKSGIQAEKSTESNKSKLYGVDKDMESTGYFTVIPTPSQTDASAILIKCDYTLESTDGSKETINVTGATAAVPAAFCKWETNTLYTYIFKISQNTNGSTGDKKEGLFPITFDATVIDSQDAQGTITTVTTPSITTYQEGSVTADGVEYKANKAIYATVAESTTGTEQGLNTDGKSVGSVKVYKLTTARNEADLQISGIIKDELKEGNVQTVTVGNTDTTVGTVKLTSGKYLSFTPNAEGYYAIQYLSTAAEEGENAKPAAYTYKIVYVAAAANAGE